MKKIISLLILIQAISGTMVYANLNTDNVFNIQTENKPILPDSVSNIATFKLYPTQNMWTFLKLNTRNGKIWFHGVDTVTKAKVWYPVHISEKLEIELQTKEKTE